VECPCRRCRRHFRPTVENLYRGSPYWWYCPACQDAQRRAELQRALRTQLTVALGRAHLLRRRLGQGSDSARVAADLEVLECALAELRTVVGQLERALAP
jgi:hypothetical protein